MPSADRHSGKAQRATSARQRSDQRALPLRASAEQEYTVVFPDNVGQIFEARRQPGTVAYSARMQLDLLQETTDEIGRNGGKKSIVVNGHGGNELVVAYSLNRSWLSHTITSCIYSSTLRTRTRPAAMKCSSCATDYHARKGKTSRAIVSRPDLVHLDRVTSESGEDSARVHLPDSLCTRIWW